MKTTRRLHLDTLVGISVTLCAAFTANSQELITNGTFTDGLNNWTQASWAGGSSFGINANGPTDTSAASGNYAYAGGGTYNLMQQNVAVTTGSAYRLTFQAGSKSGDGSTYGILSLRQEALNNYNAASFDYRPSDAAFGSYTVDFVADTTTVGVWLRNDGGGFAAYDNVSVTPIASVAHALNYSAAGGYTEITSVLSGSGKVTSNAGTGGLTLSGANTYTGGTEVTGGTLFVTGSGTLGAASGSVTVSSGGVGEVVLDLRNAQTRTGTITMTGQDARIISTGGTGSIVNNGGAFQFGGGLLQVPLSGSGGLHVTGGGPIYSANSYTGPTTISATAGWYGTNTFFVENATALGDASGDLTISGGRVRLQNNTISRSGNVTISGGIVEVGTLSKSGSAYDIQGGQIDAVLAGNAGLTKSGAGNATLTGANTYSGGTEVTGGTLVVTGSGTLGNAAGTITINGTGGSLATLDLRNAQTRTGTITMIGQDARIISTGGTGSIVNNGGAFQFGGGLLQVPISGTGGLNVTGGGSIYSANSYTGPTTISATAGWYGTNTFYVYNANALGDASGDLTISGGTVGLGEPANPVTVVRTGAVAITGGLVHTGTLSKSGSDYDIQGGQIDAVLAGSAGLTKSGLGIATLAGNNTYTGATTVSAGTLLVTGALASDVSVGANASLGGGGTVGALTFAPDSFFDIFLALSNPLEATGTISFSGIGFGIDNLLSAGSVIDWSTIADGTYTLITGDLDPTNLGNFGSANAFNLQDGRKAYFQEGSLQLVVIPEPRAALLGGLGLLALLRRRR